MLWFDDDPRRELGEKVQRAVSYYEQKYHRTAEVCYVNPAELPTASAPEADATVRVQVRSAANVLPHHFWVGAAEG